CRYRTRTCLSCFPYGCRGNQESVSLFYLLIKKSPRRNQERLGLFGVSDRRRCQPTTTDPLSTSSPRPVRSSLAAGKARRTRRSPRCLLEALAARLQNRSASDFQTGVTVAEQVTLVVAPAGRAAFVVPAAAARRADIGAHQISDELPS